MQSRARFSGPIADLSLADLVQILNVARRSAVVTLSHHGLHSRLWCCEGSVIDAESGSLEGEAAAHQMLAIEQGWLEAEIGPVIRTRRIFAPTTHLLLEAARQNDEVNRRRKRTLPPGLVTAGPPSSHGAATQASRHGAQAGPVVTASAAFREGSRPLIVPAPSLPRVVALEAARETNTTATNLVTNLAPTTTSVGLLNGASSSRSVERLWTALCIIAAFAGGYWAHRQDDPVDAGAEAVRRLAPRSSAPSTSALVPRGGAPAADRPPGRDGGAFETSEGGVLVAAAEPPPGAGQLRNPGSSVLHPVPAANELNAQAAAALALTIAPGRLEPEAEPLEVGAMPGPAMVEAAVAPATVAGEATSGPAAELPESEPADGQRLRRARGRWRADGSVDSRGYPRGHRGSGSEPHVRIIGAHEPSVRMLE